MKAIFFLAFVGNLLVLAVSLAVLPDRVAVHFGPGGIPDGWASKEANALVFLMVEVPLFLLLWFGPSLRLGLPARSASQPSRSYWLREENRPLFKAKLGQAMARFGAGLFLFFLAIGILTLLANLSQPVRLNERSFFVMVGLFLGYTVFWCIGLIRSFRVPRDRAPLP